MFENSDPTALSLLTSRLETPQFLQPQRIADWLPDFPPSCVSHTVPLETRMKVKLLHSVAQILNPKIPKIIEILQTE